MNSLLTVDWLLLLLRANDIICLSNQIGKLSEDMPTECDFLLLCELLVYAIELLYVSGEVASCVPIEVRAKLIPSWTKLMDAVTVAMVNAPQQSCPTLNKFIAMVINRLVEFFQEQEAEVGVAIPANH